MFISKNDKLRHRILLALNTKTNGQKFGRQRPDWYMSVSELCQTAQITDAEYRLVNSLLYDRKEIGIQSINGIENVIIEQAGLTSVNEKSYLKEGRKKVMDSLYDVIKWTVPLTLAFIAIYSTVNSSLQSIKNKESIDKLQAELNLIKSQVRNERQPRIFSDSLSAKSK